MKTYYCVCTSFDDCGHVVSNMVYSIEAPSRPENVFRSTSRKDIYLDWFDSLSAAQAHINEARLA